MTDTGYRYVSVDADRDISADPLTASYDGTTWDTATYQSTPPPHATTLPAPETGLSRYWWRVLVGPDETLNPDDATTPGVLLGRLNDGAAVINLSWNLDTPATAQPASCWPLIYPADATSFFDPNGASYDEARATAAVELAVATLRSLTLGLVGGCPVTVRPCLGCGAPDSRVYPVLGSAGFTPFLVSGRWANYGCGCASPCGHGIPLPPPVGAVTAVRVDGALLPSSAYWLDGYTLRRTDGQAWPYTQNLDLADTQPGTWSVTYTPGAAVDGAGALAAGMLAAEFYKAAAGSADCRLPKRATQVARQGVTVNLQQRSPGDVGMFPDGLTGLALVDTYVELFNPYRHRTRPMVWSPDLPTYHTSR